MAPPTCYNIEALLPLDEADVVGYEGGVRVRLHAGMSGLQQLQTPAAVVQQSGPDVRNRSGHRRHGEARHRVELRDDVTQRLKGIHVTWSQMSNKNLKWAVTDEGLEHVQPQKLDLFDF